MFDDYFDKYGMAGEEKPRKRQVKKYEAAVMARIGKAPARGGRVKPFAVAAAGLAAAAALTVSVGAANDWNFGKLISSFYPVNASDRAQMTEAAKNLDGMLYQTSAVKTSDTFKNYSVSFGDYIFNGKTVRISAYVAAKDGTEIEKYAGTFYETKLDMFINGKKSDGWLSASGVMENGIMHFYFEKEVMEEINEPLTAELRLNGFIKRYYTEDDYVKSIALPYSDDDVIYNDSVGYYTAKDGTREVISCKKIDGKNYYFDSNDLFETLDDGVFTAEIQLCPVTGSREFTVSDGSESLDIRITPVYLEITDTGKNSYDDWDVNYINYLHDILFVYDTDGNEMLCPDDFKNIVSSLGGGGTPETMYQELPKPIDIEKIGAIRIGGYTYGDVPPIDYEKYPHIRDYYGI